jgi:hypothetical protein
VSTLDNDARGVAAGFLTAFVILLGTGEPARSQTSAHLACIKAFREIVAKGQMLAMANALGGWSALSPNERAFVGTKALADAGLAVERFKVHASPVACQDALSAAKRTYPREAQ